MMLNTVRRTNYSKMDLNRIVDPDRGGLAERVVSMVRISSSINYIISPFFSCSYISIKNQNVI